MKTQDEDRFVLTVAEAMVKLGVSRGLLYEAVRTGQVPSIRIGRRILIPRAALDRLLNQNKSERRDDTEE